jgi:light-regulated signal transduction histidine kinase (bacteriophytochrome)
MNDETNLLPQDEDLAVCESEPLAWVGSIQANGALIVTDARGRLLYHSGNLSAWFDLDGPQAHQAVLDDLFEDRTDYFSYRERMLFEQSHFLIAGVTTNRGIAGDLLLSHHGDLRYYEFEPATESTEAAASSGIEVASLSHPLEDRLEDLLRRVHALSGFGKVMIYRFLEDETGEVIAELSDGRLDSYLGLRFPASDVPRIARALYARTPFRMIFDVDGDNVTVRAVPGLDDAVDLATTGLRSVSPIHLEYLRNMKVRSSASFSIRVTGKLWGLVALHATVPTVIPLVNRFEIRKQVDTFQDTLRDYQIKEDYKRFRESSGALDQLTDALADASVTGSLNRLPDDAESLIACDNLVILLSGQVAYETAPVPDDQLNSLVELARAHTAVGQFASDSVERYIMQSDDFRREASGLLYEGTGQREDLPAPAVEVLWLRREDAANVDWAGNPAKIREEVDGHVRISPRQSFERWSVTSRGCAVPWSRTDRQLASKFLSQLVNRVNRQNVRP